MTVPEIRRPQAITVLFSNRPLLSLKGKRGVVSISVALSPLGKRVDGDPDALHRDAGRVRGLFSDRCIRLFRAARLAVQDYRERQETVACPQIPGIRLFYDAENWNCAGRERV
jgi:hypothetical protein